MRIPFRGWFIDTWRFLLGNPKVAAVVLGAFMAGGVAGVGPQARIYNYMWRDPAFCDDCHVHDYANQAYDRSVHAGLTTCHDCHRVPIRHYPRNLVVTLFDKPQSQEDINRPEVATVICTQCHSKETEGEPLTGPMPDEIRKRVVKVDDSPLHRAHMSSKTRDPAPAHGGEKTATSAVPEAASADHAAHGERPSWDAGVIVCVDCHGSDANRAHSFTATRDDCVACHKDTKLAGGAMAGADCRQCHLSGFLGSEETAAR